MEKPRKHRLRLRSQFPACKKVKKVLRYKKTGLGRYTYSVSDSELSTLHTLSLLILIPIL